jgi:hypothetical protein
MLKPVKPREDTSVVFLSTGLYISEPANICHGLYISEPANICQVTEYTVRPEHINMPGPQELAV